MIRNEDMADYADILIAFLDEQSRDTQDIITKMERLGKKVNIIYYNQPHEKED